MSRYQYDKKFYKEAWSPSGPDYVDWNGWDSEHYLKVDNSQEEVDALCRRVLTIPSVFFPMYEHVMYERLGGDLASMLSSRSSSTKEVTCVEEAAERVGAALFELRMSSEILKPYRTQWRKKDLATGQIEGRAYDTGFFKIIPEHSDSLGYELPYTILEERVNIGGKTYIKDDEKRTLREVKKDSAFELTRKMIWAKTKDEEEKYFKLLLENYPEYV